MADGERRRRFIAYFERELRGDRAKLIERSGYTHGRISQFFDERQQFGERAAASLATRLGLPAGYFERDDRLSDDALAVAAEYETLSSDERARFKLLLEAARAAVRPAEVRPPQHYEPKHDNR